MNADRAPSTLGWVLEDRELGYVIGRDLGEVVLDLALSAWDGISDFFFSRPPAAEAPPPSAEAAPAPQDASVAPPWTEPGPKADEPQDSQDRVVGVQGSVPEPLEMVPGVDPNGGGQVFAAIRKQPE